MSPAIMPMRPRIPPSGETLQAAQKTQGPLVAIGRLRAGGLERPPVQFRAVAIAVNHFLTHSEQEWLASVRVPRRDGVVPPDEPHAESGTAVDR